MYVPGLSHLSQIHVALRHRWTISAAGILWLSMGPVWGWGQTPDEAQTSPHPLAVKQQLVQDRLVRLEDQLLRLIEKLREEDPSRAEQVQEAVRQLGAMRIREDLSRVIELLGENPRYSEAVHLQDEVLEELHAVLRILTLQERRQDDLQNELEQLREFAEGVDELIHRESALMQDTQGLDRVADAESQSLDDEWRQLTELQKSLSSLTEEMIQKMEDGSRPIPEGSQQVEQAKERMEHAASNMENQEAEPAIREQAKAIELLTKVKEQLQDRIQNLQSQKQQELLRRLEVLFGQMLQEQTTINEATLVLDAVGKHRWDRADVLESIRLAGVERGLADDVDICSRLVDQEDSLLLLPQFLLMLKQDLQSAAVRLEGRDAGPVTQRIQNDITQVLQGMVKLTQQAPSSMSPSTDNSQDSPQGEAPPVASAQELRMLLRLQENVLNGTQQYFSSDEEDVDLLNRLTERQRKIADMVRDINERGDHE